MIVMPIHIISSYDCDHFAINPPKIHLIMNLI